jgi:zinc D-Ala-D-Ala dipeptidase
MTRDFTAKQSNELDMALIAALQAMNDRRDDRGYLDVLNAALAKVITRDNAEPMVRLTSDAIGDRIFIDLVKFGVEHDGDERLQLREGVVVKLRKAAESLPNGYSLIIRDAFRTERMVWALYHQYVENLRAREPDLTEQERDLRIRNLLAMPDNVVPPGHMTGGAVDVVLGNATGARVNVEVSPDQIPRTDQAYTFCAGLPDDIVEKRRILLQGLAAQGFHNYFREYWHFSYGDAYWAVRRRDKVAVYGIPFRHF